MLTHGSQPCIVSVANDVVYVIICVVVCFRNLNSEIIFATLHGANCAVTEENLNQPIELDVLLTEVLQHFKAFSHAKFTFNL